MLGVALQCIANRLIADNLTVTSGGDMRDTVQYAAKRAQTKNKAPRLREGVSYLDMLDEMATKWAMRADRLERQKLVRMRELRQAH